MKILEPYKTDDKLADIADLCRRDLKFLCTQFLGYKDWDVVHDDVEKLLRRPSRKKALLLPRGHLKSTLVTVAYSIQQILRNPNVRILIANQVWDMSRSFMREIKAQLESSQLKYVFGEFTSPKWNEDLLVVRQRTKPYKEPTILTTGVEAETTGGHFDVIFLDDLTGLQNSSTPEQREKTKRFRRSMINLLEPGGMLIEIGCLVAGSKVLKADGTWEAIEKIKVGDKVVSHDSIETVEAMIPQGKAPVFEVKCKNFKLQATANHPFMTKKGFVRVEDLKVGDKVFILNSYDAAHVTTSKEDAWMLGFMMGDGWITHHPNSKGSMRWVTCFARGTNEALNSRALKFFKDKFGVTPKLTRFGYYRTEVAKVGRFFEGLGFKGKAKTKRVPHWVFSATNSVKNSFIDGFIDADGTDTHGHNGTTVPCAIEISNKPLAEDLKYLAATSGRSASNIYERTRLIQAPNSPAPVVSTTAHVGIGTKKRAGKWRQVTVQSITPCGVKEVYDLTVSNTHNFVANGYVVHNTRWHLDDTFSVIMEKEARYYDLMVRKVVENGKIIFPKHFSKRFDTVRKDWLSVPEENCMDYVKHLKESMPIDEYLAQYENNPISAENQVFKQEMFKYWSKRPEGLYVSMAVDLAISQRTDADYTSIAVVGADKDWNIYILDYQRGHWTPSEIVSNMFNKQAQWKPYTVGMEVNGFQRTLKMAVEDEMRRRGQYFGIDEIRNGPDKSKENRIKALEPFYRRGDVYHASWMRGKEMETELLTFPRGRTDDIIDSVVMTLPFLSAGSSQPVDLSVPGTYDYEVKRAIRGLNKGRFFHYG